MSKNQRIKIRYCCYRVSVDTYVCRRTELLARLTTLIYGKNRDAAKVTESCDKGHSSCRPASLIKLGYWLPDLYAFSHFIRMSHGRVAEVPTDS